jgi:hypothetical protein
MSHRPAACLLAAAALVLAAPTLATAREHAPGPSIAVTAAVPFPPPWVVAALPPPAPGPWGQIVPTVYYGWLDANRAAFMARWGWNPWRVARYDAWYGAYRAGLDARFAPPPRYARAHGHGNGNRYGWGRGHDRDD